MIGMLLLVAVNIKHIPFIRDKRTSFARTGLWGFVVRCEFNLGLLEKVIFYLKFPLLWPIETHLVYWILPTIIFAISFSVAQIIFCLNFVPLSYLIWYCVVVQCIVTVPCK